MSRAGWTPPPGTPRSSPPDPTVLGFDRLDRRAVGPPRERLGLEPHLEWAKAEVDDQLRCRAGDVSPGRRHLATHPEPGGSPGAPPRRSDRDWHVVGVPRRLECDRFIGGLPANHLDRDGVEVEVVRHVIAEEAIQPVEDLGRTIEHVDSLERVQPLTAPDIRNEPPMKRCTST